MINIAYVFQKYVLMISIYLLFHMGHIKKFMEVSKLIYDQGNNECHFINYSFNSNQNLKIKIFHLYSNKTIYF